MPGRPTFQFSLAGLLFAITYVGMLCAALDNELLLVSLVAPMLSFIAGLNTTFLLVATMWMLVMDNLPRWVPMSARTPFFYLLLVVILLFCAFVLWDMSGGLGIYSPDPGWPLARMLYPWLVRGGTLLGVLAAFWVMKHPDATNLK